MPLFQTTVITKYLNTQDKSVIAEKYNVFKNHFLNPQIQENIRNSKEEQYQGQWEDYFQAESQKAQSLKQQIDETDKAIDRMVYELYGLSGEEVGIVEGIN